MLYMHIIYSICILYIYYIYIVYCIIYLTQFVLYIYICMYILFCILYVTCYAVYSCSRASGIGFKGDSCLAAVQPPGLP